MINIPKETKQACNSDKIKYKEYITIAGNTAPIEIKGELFQTAYKNTHFIGTFNLSYLKFKTENDIDYKKKEFDYFKEVNGTSIKIGHFYVTEVSDNDSEEEVSVTAYDNGLKFANPYVSELDYASGTVTLMQVLQECCTKSGVELVNESITNGDFIVDSNQFEENAMYGDVVSAVAFASGNFATINNEGKLELRFTKLTNDIETISNGNVLKITNAKEYKPIEYKIDGYTKQETTEGYNLLNITNDLNTYLPLTMDGVTMSLNSDGTFHLKGNKANTSWVNFNFVCERLELKKGQTYYSGMTVVGIGQSGQKNYTGIFTPTEDIYTVKVYYAIKNSGEYNLNIVPMITTEANKSKPYEPYTGGQPSPSPDYPQEIEVGRGKNLFDKDSPNITQNKRFDVNGNEYIDTHCIISDYIKVKGGTKLSLQRVIDFNSRIVSYDKNKNKIAVSPNSVKFYNVPNSAYYVRAAMLKTEIDNYQLEVSSTPTDYVPYNTIEVFNKGKNLFDISKVIKGKVPSVTNGQLVNSLNGAYLKINIDNTKDYIWSYKVWSYIFFYDINNNYLGNVQGDFSNGKNLKTIKHYLNTSYIILRFDDYITNDNQPMLVQGTQVTPYEPYREQKVQYKLGDNFLADKDYIINGKLFKNTAEYVFTGASDENWAIESSGRFRTTKFQNIIKKTPNNVVANIKSNYFKPYTASETWSNNTINGISADVAGNINIRMKDITNINDFKTWLKNNPVKVLYETDKTTTQMLETVGELKLVTGLNNISIDNENLKTSIKYYTDKQEIIEDYVELEDKRDTQPITSVSLGMSDVEGENVVLKDQELIDKYGEHWLIINDNPFAYTEEKRRQLITDIFNKVKGFSYSSFKSKYAFKPYYELGDLIQFKNKEGKLVDSIVLELSSDYDDITIAAKSVTDAKVKYENPRSAYDIARKTELVVDKQKGEINSLTKKTENIKDDLNNNYYTKETVNTLVQNAETGVTNTFSEAGGNNIFRNTGLWFKDANGYYEYWTGNVKKTNNDNASGYNALLLQNGELFQEQEVPNGQYSISFYYQKLLQQANASVTINGKTYQLDSLKLKQFYTGEKDKETGEYITLPINITANHINIKFNCDINNAVLIYDIMCNKGNVKLAYSQNQNETTTDTVNISKGITITSTDTDTKFKADADGIRLLDQNDNIKTKFTDKGMETKEAKIANKAEVCGTLTMDVDGQTWFTRM